MLTGICQCLEYCSFKNCRIKCCVYVLFCFFVVVVVCFFRGAIHCISSFFINKAFVISSASLSLVSKRFLIQIMKQYATLK